MKQIVRTHAHVNVVNFLPKWKHRAHMGKIFNLIKSGKHFFTFVAFLRSLEPTSHLCFDFGRSSFRQKIVAVSFLTLPFFSHGAGGE